MKKLIAIALITQTVLSGYAQATPGAVPPPQVRLPGLAAPNAGAEIPRFQITFKGGTPRELIQELNQVMKGEKANVIIPPSMEKAQVPGFTLYGVTMSDVFMALNSLSDNAKSGVWIPTSGSTVPVWVLNPGAGSGSEQSTFQQRLRNVAPGTAPRGVFEVFPIGHLLTEYKVDDITTAVQTVWTMQGEDNASLKFHVDTGLLMAVGSVDKVSVVRAVLASLEQNLARKNPPVRKEDAVPAPAPAK